MSRCMRFPPPGYLWNGVGGQPLRELIKVCVYVIIYGIEFTIYVLDLMVFWDYLLIITYFQSLCFGEYIYSSCASKTGLSS